MCTIIILTYNYTKLFSYNDIYMKYFFVSHQFWSIKPLFDGLFPNKE